MHFLGVWWSFVHERISQSSVGQTSPGEFVFTWSSGNIGLLFLILQFPYWFPGLKSIFLLLFTKFSKYIYFPPPFPLPIPYPHLLSSCWGDVLRSACYLKVESTSVLPMKRWSNQTETKPQQSNALHPNELGLGRIRVTQPRVRPRQGKKGQILPELTYLLGSYATKGDTLISRVEYEVLSSVGTLTDCVGIWPDVFYCPRLVGETQSSVLRPSPRAARTRGGEGLAKLALDCVFIDQSDFTEAIRSNYIHSLRGRVVCKIARCWVVSVYTQVRTCTHMGGLVVQATYTHRFMYTWVATAVRKGEFARNTISCKFC